jgi:hypothetical protein
MYKKHSKIIKKNRLLPKILLFFSMQYYISHLNGHNTRHISYVSIADSVTVERVLLTPN